MRLRQIFKGVVCGIAAALVCVAAIMLGRSATLGRAAQPNLRFLADDTAHLYHILLNDYEFETVRPFLEKLSPGRPQLLTHLSKQWELRQLDWVWSYMEPGDGTSYEIFCVSPLGVWRGPQGLTLVGCQFEYDEQQDSMRGLLQFVASLSWPQVPGACFYRGARPYVTDRKFYVEVHLGWATDGALKENLTKRGEPIIRGSFDGNRFVWDALYDKTGRHDLDDLPEDYRYTKLKHQVTNTQKSKE